MDDTDNANGHEEEEVFEAEVVEDDEPGGEPVDDGASVDALADLAGGGSDASISALDALAAGKVAAPADAMAAAEARDKPDAEDALASLASGEVAPDPDDGEGPAETDGHLDGPAFDFAAGESIHVDPERIKAGREQRKRMAGRVDDLSFKKTMVPLLLAVGVLLLGISGLTAAMTAGGEEKPDEDRSALEEYGPLLVWAGLPLGLVLVGGAVVFHLEVRRLEAVKSLSAPPREPDAPEPEASDSATEAPESEAPEPDEAPASDE